LDVKYEGVVRSFPLRPLAFDRLSVTGLYTEVMRHTEWADFTWGLRRDAHQYAGNLWSQRLAMTRLKGDWHFKLLASAAERAPSVEDYSSSSNGLAVRKNEKVANAELEVGYRIDAGTQLTVNYFDILTRDTLILRNFNDVHTRGLEASLQVRRDWGRADLSLSTYTADGTDTATVSVTNPVTGAVIDSQALVGFSPWKLALSANYRVGASTYLSPTLTWYGPRWGFDVDNSSATVSRLRQFPTTALANLVVQAEDVGAKGLTLTAGVYNLFAAQAVFTAPIANTTPPVPDMGRELVLSVRYRF
jgi:outer membrane receptor for ferrienterochelin and colicin